TKAWLAGTEVCEAETIKDRDILRGFLERGFKLRDCLAIAPEFDQRETEKLATLNTVGCFVDELLKGLSCLAEPAPFVVGNTEIEQYRSQLRRQLECCLISAHGLVVFSLACEHDAQVGLSLRVVGLHGEHRTVLGSSIGKLPLLLQLYRMLEFG